MPVLDATISVSPVYSEMVSELRRQILSGRYADADRIATETELAEAFGISVRSVRRGIDELVAEGLLSRRQGSGTYVTNGRLRRHATTRADTIAMVLPLRLRGYHPFFSEMLRGIREAIGAHDKQMLELNFSDASYPHGDVEPVDWARDRSLGELNATPDLAGVICGASVAQELQDGLARPVPIVAVDPSDTVPYVAYDWQAEMSAAIVRQVQAGARHLWVHGLPDDWEQPWLPADVRLRLSPSLQHDRGLLSAHIRHAYKEAESAFRRWPDLDGVVVGSDYEAQGVLDAAVKCELEVPDCIRFSCLLNRESRLVYPFPLTVLMADGYQKGKRVVELLNQHMMAPGSAADRVILRCDEEHH